MYMRRLNTIVRMAVLVGLLAGCVGSAPPASPPVDPRSEVAAAAAAPKVAAMVNGQAIKLDEVHRWLIEAYGAEVIKQLTATVTVEQAAARDQITVTAEDIASEARLTLERMSPDADPAQYESILAQVLQRKGYPRIQWDTMVRRNALLRKMAARQLDITDAMLTAEFNNRYGLKVEVRLIQCASVSDTRKILQLLASGSTFADLARQYSTLADLAEVEGLLPAFSRDDRTIPPAIRSVSFDLADGQVSEIIQVDRYFYLLQRVKAIPPETEVNIADVRDELRRDITGRLMWKLQERILNDLWTEADIIVVEPVLKQAVLRDEAQAPPMP